MVNVGVGKGEVEGDETCLWGCSDEWLILVLVRERCYGMRVC